MKRCRWLVSAVVEVEEAVKASYEVWQTISLTNNRCCGLFSETLFEQKNNIEAQSMRFRARGLR